MATTDRRIAFAYNGIESPLYFDRQVIRAGDLTLDRSSRDAELARMRRYLHGWGIVGGLVPVVVQTTAGVGFLVTAGYGVTPSGKELFLGQELTVEQDLAQLVRMNCGPEAARCDDPESFDPTVAQRADGEAGELGTAWLIARPVRTPRDLRPQVPGDCEHPANRLMASRECHGISLELVCELPPIHQPSLPDCRTVSQLLWGGNDSPPIPLELPPRVAAADDFLVLARLDLSRFWAFEFLAVDLAARRRLLPLWLMQDWLIACAPAPWPPWDGDQPDTPPDRSWPWGRPDWPDFSRILRSIGFVAHSAGRDGKPLLPAILTDTATIDALTAAGITGPAELFAADPVRIMEVTGLSAAEAEQVKHQITDLGPLIGSR